MSAGDSARNRRHAALYGLIVGLTLAACLALAVACDCSARQTGVIALAGFLIASIVVGTVTR